MYRTSLSLMLRNGRWGI